jgi:hypothetical protein
MSGANKAAATGRGRWMAVAKRQSAALARASAKTATQFWRDAFKPPTRARRDT